MSMFSLKRVTSAVVASAVVLSSLFFVPDAKKNVVYAAETKYDSANLVNYATIMGRAVDYGIVSQSITQSMHMETTFATFTYRRTIDTTTDVDLTNAKTAQFIVGEITSRPPNDTLKFGKVKTSSDKVFVENMRITMSDNMDPNRSFRFQDDVAKTTKFSYSYLTRNEIQESIDTVIDHARDESDEMVVRTKDSDYVLDASDNKLVSVNGAITTININDPKYDNKVVYINLDDAKFSNLLRAWEKEPNGHHLDINKRSSTVIVFTSQKSGSITLGKVSVYAPDSSLYSSAASSGVHDYDSYASVTTYSGNQSTHNAYVDKEIAQKLIWNITKAENVTISSNAGTFLCLAGSKTDRKVKVNLEGNPCAGWLVVNGNVENKCEYHYIYGGHSQEQQSEGNGQMHFVARKGFTTKYVDKDHIAPYTDSSVAFKEGAYQFFWQEYTDSSFNTPVGTRSTVKVKDTSYLEFPTETFTNKDSSDPHYVTSTPTDFYFRITEDPSKSLPGIKNSAGYINICLRVYVAAKDEIKFKVQSVTMIGDDENSLVKYDENGTWGSANDWVDVVNARFDLGAFFNRIQVPGYMTITKTIEGDVTEEDLNGLTFTVTDGGAFTKVYKLGKDFTKNPTTGIYELTTPITVPDAETQYTVTETLYSLDGYKLEEVSYKVDGGATQHNNDTASLDSVSTDSNAPTTVAYTDSYTPLGTLTVHKTAKDNNNNNINYYYEFSVKNSAGLYLQADKQTFDTTVYFFTIGTNEEQVFENIPVGLYTITEDTNLFVYGYTFEQGISKTSGQADVTKKSNTDFTLENKFTQDLGNLVVKKTAKDNNGNDVEGSFKFTISTPMRGYLQADGTFGNTRYYFTISAGETKTFENLPADNYMITEDTDSVEVTGYTFNMADSIYSVLGRVTKNGNSNAELKNIFTQDVGTLKVSKIAQDNHDTNVSGTFEFSVKNSKGQYLQADKQSFGTTRVFFTVDAGSDTTFENLPVGKYTIEENTESISVNGFTFTTEGSKTSVVADVKKGETADAGLLNNFIQDLGSLTVAKVATDNNDKNVNGSFQFSVKNSAGKFLQSDEETFTNTEYFFTVEAGSSKTFTDLPVGEYAISEKTTGVSVPGYTYLVDDSTTKGTGTVSKVTTANSTVTLENKFEQDVGSLTVSKTAKDDNNENVSGSFKFSVKNSAGLYLQSDKKTFDTEVYFFTVAAGSTAVFNNLPVGVYTVTEDANSVAVTGYTFISSSIPEVEAEVEKNESVTAELVNNYEKDVGNLVVSKTAKDNNDKSVAGSFKFSVKNSAGLYLQSDKKTFDTAEYFFTVASGSTAEFNNLPVGVYTVTEDTGSVGVTGYTFESDSTTRVEAEVVKNDSATAELVNNYTQDTGSLTVIKSAVDNYNDTVDGEFKFSVKNSEGKFLQSDEKSFEDEEFFFTVAAGSTKKFENLPVGEYTVEEDTDSVSVTGYTFNKDDSTTSADATVVKNDNADAQLENKFTLDLGSLKISKALGDNAPDEASLKTYTFTITGPDNYSNTVELKAGESQTIEDLVPGTYTVTEDEDDAAIEGYDLSVTGGGEVSVVAKDVAETTITNTYTRQTGSLTVTKTATDNNDEAVSNTFYFSVKNSEGKYLQTDEKSFGTTEVFFSVESGSSKTFSELPVGDYTVAEDKTRVEVTGYDFLATSTTEKNVTVTKSSAPTTAALVNNYEKHLGTLTVQKIAKDNNNDDVTGTFEFSVKNGDDQYLQSDEKTFDDAEYFFTVAAGSSKIFENLPAGKYQVEEKTDDIAVSGYTFNKDDSRTSGTGSVSKISTEYSTVTLENKFTKDVGSLKITKALGANAPQSAFSKEYTFTVTGPNNFSQTVTIKGAGSKIIDNLIPGTYTVTEYAVGAIISGYDVVIRGSGDVDVSANATAEKTITNTYVLQKGYLKITKVLGANAPDGASSKTYTFTVTGPDNYSDTVEIKAGESKTITNLIPGTYTVTEDLKGAAIDGYDLEVTGGGEVSVVGNATAKTTVTNTYTKQKGSLTITKALGTNAPQGASSKKYSFTVTGPDNFSQTVTIEGAGSETLTGLEPGTYTVTEDLTDVAIDGYDLEVTGGGEVSVSGNATAKTTVTNTYTKQKGSLRIVKTLAAGYPKEAEDTVFAFTVTGVGFSKTVFITGEGSETIDNLEPGRYTVTENKDAAKIDNFDLIVTGDEGDAVEVVSGKTTIASITNTYKSNSSSKGSLKITKTLGEGAPDAANTKEYKFTVTGSGYSNTVTIKGSGSVTIVNLEPGKYSVTEDEKGAAIKGYDLKVTGGGEVSVAGNAIAETTVTNTYTETKGSLTVKKSVTGTSTNKVFSFTVTGPNNFSETFELKDGETKVLKDLPLDEYTVVENEIGENGKAQIDGYTLSVTGNGTAKVDLKTKKDQTVEITNAYTAIPMTEATVTKIWDDANDQDGIRPTVLKVALLKNGTKHSEVTLNEANGWTATVPNLPVKDGTTDNVYTWEEDANALPQGYTLKSQSTSGTVTTITNSHTPVQIVLKVVKSWDDAGAENNRPSVLTVKLLADGSEVQSFDLTEADGWTASATVPKYKNGSEISYSWTEGSMPDGYTLLSSQVSADGLTTTITNTYDLSREKTSATVKKVWDDNNNADQKRPASIEFTLSNGTVVTLSEANNWEMTVDNLPKFDASGKLITYTWTEGSMPAEYSKTGEDVSADGLTTTFTNKYTKPAPVKGSLKVTKALGADAPSDASSKIYKFKVTGTKGYEANFEIKGAGSYELTDLELDTYTVTEDTSSADIDGYTLSVSNNGTAVVINDTNQQECVITNTYTKDVEPTETNPTETNPTDTNPTDTNPTGSQPTDKSPDEDEQGPSESTTTPAPDKEIESVTIDDKPVSPDDYKKKPDGTVEFSPETIEGLTRGVHRAVIKYTDGTIVTIDFEVLASTRDGRKIVKTGDVADNNMLPTAALFAVALAAVAIVIFRKRRSESDAE